MTIQDLKKGLELRVFAYDLCSRFRARYVICGSLCSVPVECFSRSAILECGGLEGLGGGKSPFSSAGIYIFCIKVNGWFFWKTLQNASAIATLHTLHTLHTLQLYSYNIYFLPKLDKKYIRHKVRRVEGWWRVWRVGGGFKCRPTSPLRLRTRAFLSCEVYRCLRMCLSSFQTLSAGILLYRARTLYR